MNPILEPIDKLIRETYAVGSTHFAEDFGIIFGFWQIDKARISVECHGVEELRIMAINHELKIFGFCDCRPDAPVLSEGIRWVVQKSQDALNPTDQQPNGDRT